MVPIHNIRNKYIMGNHQGIFLLLTLKVTVPKIKAKLKGLRDCWIAEEADPRGHAHASRTRARKVIPVKDMTSVRA